MTCGILYSWNINLWMFGQVMMASENWVIMPNYQGFSDNVPGLLESQESFSACHGCMAGRSITEHLLLLPKYLAEVVVQAGCYLGRPRADATGQPPASASLLIISGWGWVSPWHPQQCHPALSITTIIKTQRFAIEEILQLTFCRWQNNYFKLMPGHRE